MRVDDLLGMAAPYNPRTIDDKALGGLTASVKRFGLVEPVVWNRRTRNVVGGHQRLRAAKAAGIEEVEVVIVNLPLAEEKALNIALNNPEIQGRWSDGLEALLAEVRGETPDLYSDLLLAELAAENGLAPPETEPKDAEPHIDRAAELQAEWKTERGQVWEIPGKAGTHRVMCGDSTKVEDVGRLLNGGKPFIMVTDPPYGVEYDADWRDEFNTWGKAATAANVANDERLDWTESYRLFPGHVSYVWHAGRFAADLVVNLRAAGFEIRTQIIWRKPTLIMSRGHYHWQHEPCWYAVRKGGSSKWCGDRTQSTVWDIQGMHAIGRKEERLPHATQKPLECMARPIRNHGGKGDDVYDPFLGSGTTTVAAENLSRVCYGMEISPAYAAVILQRLKDIGLSPRLAS